MRYSQLFGKTSKSIPADITAVSHQYLYKGGFIRQISAGRYAFLPLGYKVWQRIVDIIDEEMIRLGSLQVSTPTLHPIEIWQKTNRDQAFGDLMLTVDDHRGATFTLAATAEGLMTEMIKNEHPSYRELPIVIHQFSQKFRDEKRPRGGLLRTREFMMKDAYSFHATEESLLEWYEKFVESYKNIAGRFGLDVIPVEADSGAIGGDYNHEFMVLAETGEDTIVVCENCDYAANLERAEGGFEIFDQDEKLKEQKEFVHKEAVSCADLAGAMGIPVHVTTKTILFKTKDSRTKKTVFVAAMIRGDYDINETKLARHLKVDFLELAAPEEVKELTGAEVGYVGPIGFRQDVRIIADLSCQNRTNFEAGSNRTGIHLYNLNFDRDFPTPEFADIRVVKEGDACPRCDSSMLFKRAIEWGHTFHQSQFYSTPHGATFTNEEGNQSVLWQGAYGIGIGRTMATIVEVHHDVDGIVWPANVAPYQASLLVFDDKDSGTESKSSDDSPRVHAEKLYQQLSDAGAEILFDDRRESPGVKLKDADLIGLPLRIIVSSRSLADGGVEVSRRQGKKYGVVTEEEVADILKEVYTTQA